MRCDRVEFDLGAEALPHRHKGGGIRCLVHGTLELRVEGEPDRVIGLHPLLDPAAGDPGTELDHVRRSERRGQQAAQVHRPRRRADRAAALSAY
jgi:hypothetical protein